MYLSEILVLKGADGDLELFGRGMDNQVYHCSPTNDQAAGWFCIGGSLRTLQGDLNAKEAIELFGIGTEQDQGVWHSWQDASSPTGWHEWVSLGHPTE
jgi:hypothetical protein